MKIRCVADAVFLADMLVSNVEIAGHHDRRGEHADAGAAIGKALGAAYDLVDAGAGVEWVRNLLRVGMRAGRYWTVAYDRFPNGGKFMGTPRSGRGQA